MSEAIESIRCKYLDLEGLLTENARRRWAATEARALGRGGITRVAQATGIAPATIRLGLAELAAAPSTPVAPAPRAGSGEARIKGGSTSSTSRIRAPGGGRKPLTLTDPTLLSDLDALIDPPSGGEQAPLLRWTSRSTRALARALAEQGHPISQQTVAELLRELGYRLQPPRTTPGGRASGSRDLQFQHLHGAVQEFHAAAQPVVAVDMRTAFASVPRLTQNEGSASADLLIERGLPEFLEAEHSTGGWITTWGESDPPALPVQMIRMWWETTGRDTFPRAGRLLIVGPAGGSSRRSFQWKLGLQQLANETGLLLQVSHRPAGTSRWTEIAERLLGRITLISGSTRSVSYEVSVSLIASNRRRMAGEAPVTGASPELPSAEHRKLQLVRDEFLEHWNYAIAPDRGATR